MVVVWCMVGGAGNRGGETSMTDGNVAGGLELPP